MKCDSNSYKPFIEGCHTKKCKRVFEDGFVSSEDIEILLSIIKQGVASRSVAGGPTIMDLNSGFVRDGDGVINLHRDGPDRTLFSELQ